MDARRTLLAAVASAGLHVALALLLAWLCAARGGDDLAARLRALAEAQPPPTVELSDRVDVEVVVAPAEVAPAPLREGEGTRNPQHDGAPTRYAGRDRHPVAPAAGSGPGLPPVPEWTGRRDPDTLHTQLADSTAFPGRSQPGFIGGVAIVNGSSTDGVITATDVFVAPAQNFLVGQVTANQPLKVNGVRVQILNDARMPGGVLRNIYEGFPVSPASVPIGGAATVEGYFGVTGTLHATRVEVEGGTPAKVAPVRGPAKPRSTWRS